MIEADFDRQFQDCLNHILNHEGNDELQLSARQLPRLRENLTSHRLVLIKRLHCYGESLRVAGLDISGGKPDLARLGLFLLTCLLQHSDETMTLQLLSEACTVSEIRVVTESSQTLESGLRCRAEAFLWCPSQRTKNPDARLLPPALERPFLELASPDLVSICGTAAVASLAAWLLDIASPACKGSEYVLENDAGFGGVAPGSAEVRVFLPGGFGYAGR